MPHLFTTKNLAELTNNSTFDSSKFDKKSSKYIRFNIPKIKRFTRTLSIPNPLHQIRLIEVISNNWDMINSFFSQSEFSASSPVEDIDEFRAVTTKHYFNWVIREKAKLASHYKYLITTDISRFYYTIYTHSVPWALHGKETAKSNRSDSLLGNKLDKRIRNTQDEQTLGIQVGPDTSLILSEIIGTSIDIKLANYFKDIKCIRYIDDFFIFANRLSDAEKILTFLEYKLKDFELEINETKTSILELPQSLEPIWLQNLRSFRIRSTVREQERDILHFFSLAFDTFHKNKNHNVLYHALSQMAPIKIKPENWTLYESMLLQSMKAEPKLLQIIGRLLISYKEYGYDLNLKNIATAFTDLIVEYSKFNNEYVISWALWLIKELSINISLDEKILSSLKDPISILCALYLKESGNLNGTLPIKLWEQFMEKEELYGQYWILTYEAIERGWLRNKKGEDYLKDDEFYSFLRGKRCSFIDDKVKFEPIPEEDLQEEQNLESDLNIFELIYRFIPNTKNQEDEEITKIEDM